jgi:uncharacterized protein (TIGR00255 family)
MIRSMTGFGQAASSVNGIKIQVDVKSVNHRFCEIMIRMPREWLLAEDSLKKTVQQTIQRGRVDVFVTAVQESSSFAPLTVNWTMAEAYVEAGKQLRERFALADELSINELIRIPELFSTREQAAEPDETVLHHLGRCLEEALSRLLAMRETEGRHLLGDIRDRLRFLEQTHEEMVALAPQVVVEYRDKLRVRVQELLADKVSFDESRVAMEVAIMADRSNIDEELTRLLSHFHQCTKMLDEHEPVGRKLDFLIQEMNREVNTIGSKAAHTVLVNKVVEMKAEIEKIREQVQNIE